jgi:Glycosyl transferase family 2
MDRLSAWLDTMSGVAPCLSVIIASTGASCDASACLVAVAQQCRDRRIEIILATDSNHRCREPITTDCPDIIRIRLPEAATLPQLLGAAIAQATGEIIAITDATCAVDEGWTSAVLEAHRAPHLVIGGAVEPDRFQKLADWAAYFCDYGQFMLPLAEGVVSAVPGNNLSMKRGVLARGSEYVGQEFWKTYWCRRLQAEGILLYSTPSMIVSYRKSFRFWRYLAHRFHNGRCFAGMRNAQLTWVSRAAHWAGSTVLPLLFCARLLRAVLPKGRYRRPFFLSFPMIVLAIVSWALGEFCGYLLGPGTSCRHVG